MRALGSVSGTDTKSLAEKMEIMGNVAKVVFARMK